MNRFIFSSLFILLTIGILTMLMGSVEAYTVTFQGYEYTFNFHLQDAVNTIIAGVIGGLTLVGLQLIGSGLNDETVRILSSCIIYATLWTCISMFSETFITDIPIFGLVIWSIISLVYVIGVFIEISEGGASIESN